MDCSHHFTLNISFNSDISLQGNILFFLNIFLSISFFFNKFIFCLVLAALGLRCCTRAFSSYGEYGLLCCGAWASHCSGFSCCRAWALGTRASVVVARGLSSCGSQALERRLSSCGTRA